MSKVSKVLISSACLVFVLAACMAPPSQPATVSPLASTVTAILPTSTATSIPPTPTSTPSPLTATGPWGVAKTDDGIWAFNTDGGSLQQLTRDNIRSVAVSPSGGKVAYLADYNSDDPNLERISLRLLSLPDRMIETITDVMVPLASLAPPTLGSSPNNPTPDFGNAQADIYSAVESLDWSPDGQRLAFVSGRDGLFANVYVYDLRTGAVTRMTDRPYYDYGVKWSPTGEYIFFSEANSMGRGAGISGGSAWVLRTDSPQAAPVWGIPAPNTATGIGIFNWISTDTLLLEYNTQPCGINQLSQVDVVTGKTQTLWQAAEWGDCIEQIVRDPVSGDSLLNQTFINQPPTDLHIALLASNGVKRKDVNPGDLRTYLLRGSYPDGLNLAGSAAPVSASLPETLIPIQSLDGNLWAWLPWPTWPITEGDGLWIGNAGQPPEQVFAGPVKSFSWSPDSQTMFFDAGNNLYIARWPDLKPEAFNPALNTTHFPYALNVNWVYSSGTATPSQLPIQTLEFSDLSAAQKSAGFPLWLPGFIPEDLPFYKARISDYADGSEKVRLLYSEPGDSLDATLKSLDIQMTETDQPLTLDSITHQFRETAWDVREVQVRGQTGYSYWEPAVAMGNSAHLDWREGSFNFSISLYGDWPQPDENHPHALDDLLLKIAGSLQTRP